MCVTFVVFTDCESCTRRIFTNPVSMEAGECGLTRGTCLAVRRLELVAVAGRLWISLRVCGGAAFFFFSERTRPAATTKPHLVSCTSLGVSFVYIHQMILGTGIVDHWTCYSTYSMLSPKHNTSDLRQEKAFSVFFTGTDNAYPGGY